MGGRTKWQAPVAVSCFHVDAKANTEFLAGSWGFLEGSASVAFAISAERAGSKVGWGGDLSSTRPAAIREDPPRSPAPYNQDDIIEFQDLRRVPAAPQLLIRSAESLGGNGPGAAQTGLEINESTNEVVHVDPLSSALWRFIGPRLPTTVRERGSVKTLNINDG